MANYDGIYACAPATVRGQPSVLTVDSKGQKLLYGCGKAVVIRSVADPLKAELYTDHQKDVTCARFSPNGGFVCSGDSGGNVKVWSADTASHPIKFESQCLAGAVCDIQWSGDGTKVVVVGEGRGVFGSVFTWDTGSTVGEIAGHSKKILSCDVKQVKPFQIATGSEDFQVNLFDGPPFKFKAAVKDHTKFANCVRYSPDGNKLATVGSDMKVFIYDANSGAKLGECKGHTGSVYSCSWSSDSRRLATASADKTLCVWDTSSFSQVGKFAFADKPVPEDMQVACVWVPGQETIISLSLRGELYYCDATCPGKPSLAIKGHNKSINALAVEPASGTLVSGSYDGMVNRFTLGNAAAAALQGKGHTNAIVELAVCGQKLLSCAMDDTLRVSDMSNMTYTAESVPLGGQPSGLAVSKNGSLALVSTNKAIVVLRGQAGAGWRVVSTTPVTFAATAVSLSPGENEVAVGGDDKGIHIYSLAGDKLNPGLVLTHHTNAVTKVAYSPDGSMLASGDATKEVVIWDAAAKKTKVTGLTYHQGKVTCLAWAGDSRRFVTGSLDCKLIVWDATGSTDKPLQTMERAHQGGVNGVRFVANDRVASAGADCNIKLWTC